MRLHHVPTAALCWLALAAPGTRAADPTVTSVTGDELVKLIEEEGFRGAKVEKPNKEMHIVVVKMEGYNVVFYCNQADGLVQASFGLRDVKNASLRRINDWNESKRFFKAYLDKDGDPRFTYDLVIKHGVTKKSIREFIGVVPVGLKAFLREVCE